MKLQNYMQDGACASSRAVLAYLQAKDQIGWDKKLGVYVTSMQVDRWHNCREQGYIVSLQLHYNIQLNIAFFEHRNSDSIHAIKWEQLSINPLTIDNAKFGSIYKDKFDTSFSVKYNEVTKMAKWIYNEFEKFYEKNKNVT